MSDFFEFTPEELKGMLSEGLNVLGTYFASAENEDKEVEAKNMLIKTAILDCYVESWVKITKEGMESYYDSIKQVLINNVIPDKSRKDIEDEIIRRN